MCTCSTQKLSFSSHQRTRHGVNPPQSKAIRNEGSSEGYQPKSLSLIPLQFQTILPILVLFQCICVCVCVINGIVTFIYFLLVLSYIVHYKIYNCRSSRVSKQLDFNILSTTQGHLRTIKLCHKQLHISKLFSYYISYTLYNIKTHCQVNPQNQLLHKHKTKHTYTNIT